MIEMVFIGTTPCPTPACTYATGKPADVVDIGARRFVICQECGAHRGFTGWSLERIQAEYKDNQPSRDRVYTDESPKPTHTAMRKCAEWLNVCLELGWAKSELDALEVLWWRYHDHRGNLKGSTA